MAVTSCRTTIGSGRGGAALALVEARLDRLDHLVAGVRPCRQVLLGRVPHLGVDDAVGGEVLRALGARPGPGPRRLHTATVWSNVSR